MTQLQDLPCCIQGLDEILGGFKAPSTILIAGTSGVGKTTMVLQMLSNAAKMGEKTLYIPLITESPERFNMFLSTFHFLDEKVKVHYIKRPSAEKDPLSTLIDIDNVISSENPQRLVIDPITPIGFGFIEQERRRFFYTLDSMVKESNAIVMLTGELQEEEIHGSVTSHLVDGILYLSRKRTGYHTLQKLSVLKMLGVEPDKAIECNNHKYDYEVSSEGFRVYPDLKAKDHSGQEQDRIPSGVNDLDTMMGGGIPSGNSILVAGSPGTGKSILCWQFIAQGLQKDEACIMVTYTESPEQIILEANKFGWELGPYIDKGLLHIIHANPQDIYPSAHAMLIKETVENMGAKRLVIDGLVNIEITMPDIRLRRGYLQSLTSYLKGEGTTTMFTTELLPCENDSIMSKDASFIMDTIITLKNANPGDESKRHIQILKSRGTKHDLKTKEYAITEKGFEIKS